MPDEERKGDNEDDSSIACSVVISNGSFIWSRMMEQGVEHTMMYF